MYILLLSIIVFVIPLLICFILYMCNNQKMKNLKYKLDIEKDTTKNLENMFYNMLDNNDNK